MCYRVNADLTWKKFADHDRKASNCSYEEEETIWTREQKTTCFRFLFLSNVTLLYDSIKRVYNDFHFFFISLCLWRNVVEAIDREKNNLRKVLNYNIVFDVLCKSLFNCCSIMSGTICFILKNIQSFYIGICGVFFVNNNKKIWLFASLKIELSDKFRWIS